MVVSEDRLALFEGCAMLPLVESVLALVPYKPEIMHKHSVTTRYLRVNSLFFGYIRISPLRECDVIADS